MSPTAGWSAVLGVVVIATLVVVRFSRYPEWDEAVFLSQSGGFQGIETNPSRLVASREVGTPVVLGLLRMVNPSLANTRLLWMVLSFAILVLGMVQLGRMLGFSPIAGVAVVSTYWLSFSFWSSFFSIFIATSCMLLAAGIYLSLRSSPRHVVGTGVALGLVLAACLWFRQVESALFVVLMVGHSLAVTPRSFWAKRWRGIVSAAVTLVVAFGIPWVIDSIRRFGSVSERLSSGQGQSFERGVSSQFLEYLGSLSGQSQTYGDMTTPPAWAVVLLGVLLLAALVTAAACLLRRVRGPGSDVSDDGVRGGGLLLLWLGAVTQMGFFMFFIGVVMDRYMVSGAMFVLVAMLASVWPLLARWLDGRARSAAAPWGRPEVVLVGVFSLWVVANSVIAMDYEQARFDAGRDIQGHVTTIRALAQGEPCFGVSRHAAPRITFGTGCHVRSARTAEAALETVERQQEHGGFRFILWPARDAGSLEGALGAGARSIRLEGSSGRQLVLQFTTEAS